MPLKTLTQFLHLVDPLFQQKAEAGRKKLGALFDDRATEELYVPDLSLLNNQFFKDLSEAAVSLTPSQIQLLTDAASPSLSRELIKYADEPAEFAAAIANAFWAKTRKWYSYEITPEDRKPVETPEHYAQRAITALAEIHVNIRLAALLINNENDLTNFHGSLYEIPLSEFFAHTHQDDFNYVHYIEHDLMHELTALVAQATGLSEEEILRRRDSTVKSLAAGGFDVVPGIECFRGFNIDDWRTAKKIPPASVNTMQPEGMKVA